MSCSISQVACSNLSLEIETPSRFDLRLPIEHEVMLDELVRLEPAYEGQRFVAGSGCPA
jgi:hypothetical protein